MFWAIVWAGDDILLSEDVSIVAVVIIDAAVLIERSGDDLQLAVPAFRPVKSKWL